MHQHEQRSPGICVGFCITSPSNIPLGGSLRKPGGPPPKPLGPRGAPPWRLFSRGKKNDKNELVVEATPLKNMLKSNWESFPQGCGVNIPKIFEVSPPRKPTVLPSKWIGYSNQLTLAICCRGSYYPVTL